MKLAWDASIALAFLENHVSPLSSPATGVAATAASAQFYSLNDLARIIGKSPALLYRRLTETPQKYLVRFAHQEGRSWLFPKDEIDDAVAAGESILIRNPYIEPEPCLLETEGDMSKRKFPQNIRKHGERFYVRIQNDDKRKEVYAGKTLDEAIRTRDKILGYSDSMPIRIERATPQTALFTFRQAVREHEIQHLKLLKSHKNMMSVLKNPLKVFGSRDVRNIHWKEIESYKNLRMTEVSKGYVFKELTMMGAVLDRQILMERITINPAKLVKKPAFNNQRQRILTHEEFRKLLMTPWEVDNRGSITMKYMEHHIQLALILADYTGLRISEVLAVEWKNVFLDADKIFIPESKTMVKRYVPIHAELKKILEAQVRTSPYAISYNGSRVQDTIRKGFINARSYSKVEDVVIHDFRHRAITRWIQDKKPLAMVMKASGHSTMESLMRYVNLSTDDVLELVDKESKPIPVFTFAEYQEMVELAEKGKKVGKSGQGHF